jgi:multidrug efflux pump subunit AcrB
MGIVRFALRLPHTFYVLAILILFLGVTAIRVMPTDIFPQINIPVVTVIDQLQRQQHPGYRGADAQRHFGPEDLFPARRQS